MKRARRYSDLFFLGEYDTLYAAFTSLPYSPRRTGLGDGVTLEVRSSLVDRFLSLLQEGTKGAWCVMKDERIIAFGFDEYMKVSSTIAPADRSLLVDLDLMADRGHSPLGE